MNVREILEAKNKTEPVKPRNFVAKNAINTGAGAHKDKKKAAKQGDVKHKSKEMAEGTMGEAGYRDRRDSYQRDYDHSTAGMGKRQSYAYQQDGGANDEGDDDSFLRAQQEKEQGPWYLKVNGKILTSQGQPKVFDMKKGANNYALAILKNKPELQGKIFLTKRADNDVSESATAGATAAANVSVGPVYKNKSAKTPKNKDGTAKNAVDIKGANLITGGSLVKR
jgi:hypothetical protein